MAATTVTHMTMTTTAALTRTVVALPSMATTMTSLTDDDVGCADNASDNDDLDDDECYGALTTATIMMTTSGMTGATVSHCGHFQLRPS